MRTLLVTLILCVLAFGQETRVIGTKSLKDMPGREYSDASKAYKAQNYTKAVSHIEKALEYLNSYKNAKKDEIPEKYTKVSTIEKYYVASAILGGMAAGESGDYTKAESFFDQAIQTDGRDTKAWYEYGSYLFEKRNKSTQAENSLINVTKIAEEDLPKAKGKDAKNLKRDLAKSYFLLGEINKSKNPSKAISYYNSAIDNKSGYYQAMLLLGKVYQEQKEFKNMLTTFTKLSNYLESGAKSRVRKKYLAGSMLHKGIAQFELKQYKASSVTLTELMNLKVSQAKLKKSEQDAMYYYLGMAYKGLNNKSLAKQNFKKATGQYRTPAEYEIEVMENAGRYTN